MMMTTTTMMMMMMVTTTKDYDSEIDSSGYDVVDAEHDDKL